MRGRAEKEEEEEGKGKEGGPDGWTACAAQLSSAEQSRAKPSRTELPLAGI